MQPLKFSSGSALMITLRYEFDVSAVSEERDHVLIKCSMLHVTDISVSREHLHLKGYKEDIGSVVGIVKYSTGCDRLPLRDLGNTHFVAVFPDMSQASLRPGVFNELLCGRATCLPLFCIKDDIRLFISHFTSSLFPVLLALKS